VINQQPDLPWAFQYGDLHLVICILQNQDSQVITLTPMLDHKARVNGHSAVSGPESASESTNSGIQSDEELDAVRTEPETSTNATVNGNSSDHRVYSIIYDDT